MYLLNHWPAAVLGLASNLLFSDVKLNCCVWLHADIPKWMGGQKAIADAN